MNPLIQKKLDEAQGLYNRYSNGSVRVVPEAVESFLTTALQEALIAGLELAESAVEENDPSSNRETSSAYWGNTLRSRLAALKKEVMEGMK